MSFSIANTALNAHTEQLNTISNNIANSATKGFKASRTEFSSMYAQSQPLGSRSAACHKISAKTAKRKKKLAWGWIWRSAAEVSLWCVKARG